MIAKIVPIVMDDRDFDTPRLGSWEGKIPGPKTNLPIPAPEPVPAWDDMSWWERIDSIKPGLAVTTWLVAAITILGSIAMVVAAPLNGVL